MKPRDKQEISALAAALSKITQDLWSVSNFVVIDESVFSYTGKCPVKVYIPRKPHPNGLLSYGMCCWTRVGAKKLPVLLDSIPYCDPKHKLPAQASMMELIRRFVRVLLSSLLFSLFSLHFSHLILQEHPQIHPHLVADSAFGSFTRIEELRQIGCSGVFSMSSQITPWLWKMLTHDCSVDEGRCAYSPETGLVVSAFSVMNDKGKLHIIKSIGSGIKLSPPEDLATEDVVCAVLERRTHNLVTQYHTQMGNNLYKWLPGSAFFSDDGTVTDAFLQFAQQSDFEHILSDFTANRLKEMCVIQELKGTGDKRRLIKRLVKYYVLSQVPLFSLRSFSLTEELRCSEQPLRRYDR